MMNHPTRRVGLALSLIATLSITACEPRGGDPVDAPDMASSDMQEEVFKPGKLVIDNLTGTVSEEGDAAVFEISLSREPGADVLVIATSLDASEGRVISAPMTFTSETWDKPQELTIQGVDDPFADRDQEYPVTLFVLSDDLGFKPPRPLRMTTTDDDQAAYWVDVIEDTMAEDRRQRAQVRVRIATPPEKSIIFDLELDDPDEGILSLSQLEFRPGDPLEAFIFIDGRDDLEADGDQQVLLTLTPTPPGDKAYVLLGPEEVDLISIDGVCGNNVLEAVEGCDDGNTTTEICDYGLSCCTVCNSQCEEAAGDLTGFCGDEIIQSTWEECDGDVSQLCDPFIRREHGDARCENACSSLALGGCHKDQATQLAVGADHACFLATRGDQMPQELVCWGDNRSGQATVPAQVNGPGLIAAGDETTCVGQGNSVICWGEWGEMMSPPFFNTNGDVIALDVAGKRMCALSSMGALTCHNFDTRTTSPPPTPEPNELLVDVKVGDRHGCWLNDAGGVKCWGFLDEILTPPTNVSFTSIDVGTATACGITTSGALRCWGETPMILAPSGLDFTQVSVGDQAACALRQDQSVVCWGDPRIVDEAPAPEMRLVSIDVDAQGACGLFAGGDIHCWGRGDYRRIANPSDNHSVNKLVAGSNHICTHRGANAVSCWGNTSNSATDLPAGTRPSDIAAGNDFTCYNEPSLNEIICLGSPAIQNNIPWGNASSTLLGRGDVLCSQTLSSITCRSNDTNFTENNFQHFTLTPNGGSCMAAQGNIIGACAPTGSLPSLNVCQSGIGAQIPFWSLANATRVSSQQDMVCAALEPGTGCNQAGVGGPCCCLDGSPGCCDMTENQTLRNNLCNMSYTHNSVYCFANNMPSGYIRIGVDGEPDYPQIPLRPETLVSGRAHTCVLDATGQIQCWGEDTFGQASPPPAMPQHQFEALTAGEDFTCAIDTHGRYMCWGALVMPLR